MNYEDELEAMKGYGSEPGEQGSPEWLYSRIGHCTASRFKDVLDLTKAGKEGAKRRIYRLEVLAERLTGKPVEHYVNRAMEHGIEYEGLARIAYEAHTGAMVEQVGFQHHPTIKWCGGSCDGLVNDDGMIEIKAPTSATHLTTILTQECEHLPQIQGYLWITGRHWCHFISYDPRMPAGLQLFVQLIARDEKYIAMLSAAVVEFLAEVQGLYDGLMIIEKRNRPAAQTIDLAEEELGLQA